MPRNREQEAGLLYERGAQAVRAGGDELHMLAGHLALMIKGTVNHPGALWPVRLVPPEEREIRLDRFIDYLRKPAREGLGLPSLYFLRQVLKASPNNGDEALDLVRKELAKEHVDLDAVANQEEIKARDAADRKRQQSVGTNQYTSEPVSNVHRLSGNTVEAVLRRLRKDDRHRPIYDRLMQGEISANAAAIEAGFRKKPKLVCPKCGHEFTKQKRKP